MMLARNAAKSSSPGGSEAPASSSRRSWSTFRKFATTPPVSNWTAQQVRTRIEQFDAQLEQLRAPGQRAAAERTKAEGYAGQLSGIYAPAGITEPDMERAADAWDTAVGHAEAHRASSNRLAEAE